MNYTGFSGQTNVVQEIVMSWVAEESGSAVDNQVQVDATANYLNGSTTVVVPDLSGVIGFLTNPASGTTLNWVARLQQQSSSYALTSDTPPLNATWSAVSSQGTYTVP